MLTIAYCRVSTEEQAEEGFSIEGQTDRLRSYATAHDLGSVTIVADPGWSGKNLDRPGLQRILSMIEAGHVAHVLVWRLDRLSRDLGDLIVLADLFGSRGVGLHSVTENLDLSTATGRMYFNIIGTFAQFYREQLSENVRMGMAQAAREGKWTNRPKVGYDLIDGELVVNADASSVRRVFRLRAEGMSQQQIADRTGIKRGTVVTILQSRIYLGEVLLNGTWYPGRHEAIISEAEFTAAHRGFRPGKRRGRDLLSGRVRCGMCARSMSVDHNGQGHVFYRCAHRGTGCRQPRRSNKGLLRAALLGLRLLGCDPQLQEAIRRELTGPGRGAPLGVRPGRPAATLASLTERQRKLLELYYEGKISADLFAQEEARLTAEIERTQVDATEAARHDQERDEVAQRFEQIVSTLADLDLGSLWDAATEQERRVLVEELVEHVAVFPDHLEVTVHGAPRLNVLLSEVGLVESQNSRVGGGVGSHEIGDRCVKT